MFRTEFSPLIGASLNFFLNIYLPIFFFFNGFAILLPRFSHLAGHLTSYLSYCSYYFYFGLISNEFRLFS